MAGNYPAGVTDNDPHFDLPNAHEDEDDIPEEATMPYVSNAITKRPEIVYALYLTNNVWYTVGGNGVTAIEPYDEYGEMSYVPWFNVWRGQSLWLKVNAAHVRTVEYKQEEGANA